MNIDFSKKEFSKTVDEIEKEVYNTLEMENVRALKVTPLDATIAQQHLINLLSPTVGRFL